MSTEQQQPSKSAVEREIAAKTRRSFLTGGIAALAGLGAYEWLKTRSHDGGIPWPLRRSLEVNEKVTGAYFSPARLAPEYSLKLAEMPRVNGDIGIDDDDYDPSQWKLQVQGLATGSVTLTMDAIYALPKVEFVTQLKCIEGWSNYVRWGGARFSDFVARYHPAHIGRDSYVSLATPAGGYYVGLDIASALHPQTLLCYEMDGKPLDVDHGAPLRLATPIKYGIKNLKRIGAIAFTDTRPRDFWGERGYDYYAGF